MYIAEQTASNSEIDILIIVIIAGVIGLVDVIILIIGSNLTLLCNYSYVCKELYSSYLCIFLIFIYSSSMLLLQILWTEIQLDLIRCVFQL